MEWNIRVATIEDYDALCALFAQVDQLHITALPDIFRPVDGPARDRDHLLALINSDDARLFVAELDGSVIGLAEARIRDASIWPISTPRRWVHINDVVVHEHFRGQGIGRALLARVEQWARSLGIGRVELNVGEFNTPARALYEREGFRTLTRTMCKDLDHL